MLLQLRLDPEGNAFDREYLYSLTKGSDQQAVLEACADGATGFIYWMAGFCWTYNPRIKKKYLPFIPWPVQVKYGRALWNAIDQGHDVLGDKSRDMGASWMCLYALMWWWLFEKDIPLLCASRKEAYVDDGSNPDSLFWKIDSNLSRLPQYMMPNLGRRDRKLMHLHNPLTGSVIDGESTNTDLGRGGRRKAILLDEFAAVENGNAILAATADTTPCRIFNSTPQGLGNAFANVRFSGKVKVITLGWWDHPDKGKDKRLITLPDGKKKWTSPWYERECNRRVSKKEIAQELDINYLGSGETFFDLEVLQRIRGSGQLRASRQQGELQFRVDTHATGEIYGIEDIKWAPDEGRKRLRLWCPLVLDPNIGHLRPTQAHNYVAFADISLGQGQSNSVIDVWDVNTSEQVAQFVCPDTPPHSLGHIAVALAKWFGGACGWTFLGWEANGPGQAFGVEVIRAQYPYIYHMRDITKETEPRGPKYGWWSDKNRKTAAFFDLDRAVGRGEVIIHEEQTISEMEGVIFDASGMPIQATMVDENSGARANHGDRVITAAGCVMLMHEQPKAKPPQKPVVAGSFGHRKRQYREKTKKPAHLW